MEKKSCYEQLSSVVTGIEIGPKVITGHFPTNRPFHSNHPISGNTLLPMQPIGDMGLANTETLSQCGLATCQLYSFQQRSRIHMSPEYNTDSVIDVNTQSVNKFGHSSRMPKMGKTSDFWLRLKEARSACTPPKLMNQTTIAKEYGVRQSAVTKWKTGLSEPDIAIGKKMCIDYNICLDWLYIGVGNMRPSETLDPITAKVRVTMEGLNDAAKLEVLKAAIVQRTIDSGAVSEQLKVVAAEQKKAKETSPRHRRVA